MLTHRVHIHRDRRQVGLIPWTMMKRLDTWVAEIRLNRQVGVMALWFDVTDLIEWRLPYLTGIQRTAVTVLAELLATRQDVRIFAYDSGKRTLEEIDSANLPSIVRDNFYVGKWPPRPPKAEADTTRLLSNTLPLEPLPPASASPAPPEFTRKPRLLRSRHWLRRHALQLLDRCGDDATRAALKDILRRGKNLLLAVCRRPAYRRVAQPLQQLEAPEAVSLVPPSITPDSGLPRPLFEPGDVCVSLSATWGPPGYAEAIARNKLGGSVKCINLIYDLIPTLFPQLMPLGVSPMVTLWVRRQIFNADLILTISEFQRQEIQRYIASDGLPARSVRTIRLGDNPPALQEKVFALPRFVPLRKFALCVSTVDIRKNHNCLYHV